MSKYKKTLVNHINEQKIEEKKQSYIRKKYGICEEEKVIVVEKNHWIKFIIKTISAIIKVTCQIAILMLSMIGLMTILYPEIRYPFLSLLYSIRDEIILLL